MGTFVGVHNRVYLGQVNLTGYANRVNFGDLTRTMQTCTTFNDGGYTCVKPGLISATATIEGYQDFASGAVDDNFSVDELGTQFPLTVIPNPTGTVTVGDAAWLSRGVEAKLDPLSGAKGDMGGFLLEAAYDTAIVQGKVAHAGTAVTTSGSSSAFALTGPTSSQSLYAALHVTAYSGLTNVVVKVQTDDNANFTSATDRITFTTATGLTSQWSSVAGSFSTETHCRVLYTLTGSGSVTFACAVGVI
jgi:hypothetical protein